MAVDLTWEQYVEIVLSFVCLVLIVFDLKLIVRYELYKSYGIGCIFILITFSIIMRAVYLIYSIFKIDSRSYLFTWIFVLAPDFLITMVSLSFYIQWIETYHFLKRQDLDSQYKKKNAYHKLLIILHCVCFLLFILDILPRIVYSVNKQFFTANSWQILFICGETFQAVLQITLLTGGVVLFVKFLNLFTEVPVFNKKRGLIIAYFSFLIFDQLIVSVSYSSLLVI